MTQLRRGAARLLEQIKAELDDIREATEASDRKAVNNPAYVRDRNVEIRQSVGRIVRLIDDELREQLRRADSADTTARLNDLEERIRALEAERDGVRTIRQAK